MEKYIQSLPPIFYKFLSLFTLTLSVSHPRKKFKRRTLGKGFMQKETINVLGFFFNYRELL